MLKQILCIFILASTALAGTGNSTQPQLSPSKISEGLGSGNLAWTKPGNAGSINAVVATASAMKNGWRTNYLDEVFFVRSTIIGAATNAIISGFEVRLVAANSSGTQITANVQMLNGAGTLIGSAETATSSASTLSDIILGSDSDTWGQTTYQRISQLDKNFGFRVYFTNDVSASNSIDYDGIAVTVYFYYVRGLMSQGAGM